MAQERLFKGLANAPPIPKHIHEAQRDHLNESWNDRMAARQTNV